MASPSSDILPGLLKFCLFTTSYAPLFLLIAIRQYFTSSAALRWGGVNKEAFLYFLQKFGLATACVLLVLLAILGLTRAMAQLRQRTSGSGVKITVCDINNKNSEAISYISTYIIPFVFQDFEDPFQISAILILLVVVYFIYTNSNLLLINPLLSIRYSLLEISFTDSPNATHKKTGLLLIRAKSLEEGGTLLVKKVGHRLYYGELA